LIGTSFGSQPGNASPQLPVVEEDDNISEWSADGGALLTPTSTNSAWTAISGGLLTPTNTSSGRTTIGGGAMTPIYSDNASRISFTSNGLAAVWSSAPAQRGNELRCYLCKPERKSFGSVKALHSHIMSAVHAPKIFHCPFAFMPKVQPRDLATIRRFSTLGGLTQHLESGRCEGGLEIYGKAIAFVEEQLKKFGFGDLKLLSPRTVGDLEGVVQG
jgi:hypothetical protein